MQIIFGYVYTACPECAGAAFVKRKETEPFIKSTSMDATVRCPRCGGRGWVRKSRLMEETPLRIAGVCR